MFLYFSVPTLSHSVHGNNIFIYHKVILLSSRKLKISRLLFFAQGPTWNKESLVSPNMQYVQATFSLTKEQVGEGEVRPLCNLCMI